MHVILFLISMFLFTLLIYQLINRKNGIIKNIQFKHIEGIESLANGIDVNISFNENSVSVDDVTLRLSSIRNLEINSSKQLVDKEKSVIGRAIVGGVLTGGIGAVVGGMSGINDGSKETKLMHYLTMNFYDGSKAIFSFKNDSDKNRLDRVIQKVNSY